MGDHNPLQLTHPIAFNVSKPDASKPEDGSPAPMAVDGEARSQDQLSAAERASGKRWSAKVVLFSGIAAQALYTEDAKNFQVGAKVLVVLGLRDCCLYQPGLKGQVGRS